MEKARDRTFFSGVVLDKIQPKVLKEFKRIDLEASGSDIGDGVRRKTRKQKLQAGKYIRGSSYPLEP